MQKTGKIVSWGFVVSLLSLLWAVFTWIDSGSEQVPDWQDKQNRLLTDLIEETRKSRIQLEKLSSRSIKTDSSEPPSTQEDQQPSIPVVEDESPAPAPTVAKTPVPPARSETPATETVPPAVKPDDKAEIENQDKRQTQDPAIGKTGWVFFGKFSQRSKSWDADYSIVADGFDTKNLSTGDTVTIAVSVGFNNSKPVFPKYEKGTHRIYPFTLEPGSVVEVLNVDDDVGWRGFTWAEVKILSNARIGG